MRKPTFIALAALAIAIPAGADEERRGLGAHEHGHGTVNMAIEGHKVLIELHAPGADIVGFEYAATTGQDRNAVAAAKAALNDPLALFGLPQAAACRVESAEVALVGEAPHHHDSDRMHPGSHHAEAHQAAHSEFHAEYALRCDRPAALARIGFPYFDRFPRALELDVNVVTARGQKSYEVKRDARVLFIEGLM